MITMAIGTTTSAWSINKYLGQRGRSTSLGPHLTGQSKSMAEILTVDVGLVQHFAWEMFGLRKESKGGQTV